MSWSNGSLASVTPSGGTAITYTYDTNGLRQTKSAGNHKYYYNGSTLLAETFDGGYIEYMYDESGKPQSIYYNNGSTTSKYYFIKNLQGDVIQLRDYHNNLVAKYIYDPWGKGYRFTSS